MPEIELLQSGKGEYGLQDTDPVQTWMRDRKRREFVDKTTTAAAAVLTGMSVKPLIAPRAKVLAPLTERERLILREESDPGRAIVGRTAKA